MECIEQSKAGFVCPINAHSNPSAQSLSDCKCKNGYVAYNKGCVYAYVFHVHGRAFIQGNDLTDKMEDFKNAMAKALGVQKEDILPYRINQATDFRKVLAQDMLDTSRVIIAEGSTGKETATNNGQIVSFAVHMRGNSMSTGNTLVDELKSSKTLQNFDANLKAATTISMTKVFIWALTAQFWHPPATIKECDPNHKGVSKTNHLGVTDHAHDGEFAKDQCTQCVQDWQCQPADCFSNGQATDFDAAAVKAGNMVCKTKLTCSSHTWTDSQSRTHSGNFCLRPYTWATKYTAAITTPVAATPTAKPTRAPTMQWRRAKVHVPIDIIGVVPASLNYDARTRLLTEFASMVGVPAQDVHYVKINPLNRDYDDATYLAHNQSYSQAHHSASGTRITFGVFAYSQQNVRDIVQVVSPTYDPAFANKFKAHVSTTATAASVGKVIVIPEKINAPTVLPTMAPTHSAQVPGSKNSCTEGTVMEIRGTARLQSLYDLENPLDRIMTFMDDSSKGLRQCMASKAGGNTQWCNVVVLNWDVKKMTIFKDQLTFHQHEDLGETRFSKYAYIYTFAFVLAVPGQNMHTGNDVFSKMNKENSKPFISQINYCTSGREDKGKTLVPINYHEGVKLTKYDEDMFNEPMIESMNMTSIELTYVAKTPTTAPTAPPSFRSTDCRLSEWSDKSACDKTCGKGHSRQWRIILEPAYGNGAQCGSTGFETEKITECVEQAKCPVDCEVSEWKDWQACSVSCGVGTRKRERTVTSQPGAGGLACPQLEETMSCKERACPVDCQLSAWSTNNQCSKSCGGGTLRRYRRILNAPMYGGKACDQVTPLSKSASTTGPLEEEEQCGMSKCPVDCVMSRWSAWGSCSKTCGNKPAGTRLYGAKQWRTRYIVTAPSADGVPCGSLTQQRLCALHPCGAHVCTTDHGFPLTCTYEDGVVYTHHVNDVHDNELFMCYHNYVTEVCTCLCWKKADLSGTGIDRVARKAFTEDKQEVPSSASNVDLFFHSDTKV